MSNATMRAPEYFPQKIFDDYKLQMRETWRRFFDANKKYFIDKGDVLQVNIDEIFRNTGNAGKQKERLMNCIDENCVESGLTVGVNWFLRKKEFYQFIDYQPNGWKKMKHTVQILTEKLFK